MLVRRDHTLTTNRVLPRSQLNDHVPGILVKFADELRGIPSGESTEPGADAAAHGLHRWQQGYDLHEVTRELGFLNRCMVEEIHDYAAGNAGVSREALKSIELSWAAASSMTIEQSTSQYFQLQRLEASGHVNELEDALTQVKDLEQQRAELWRQIAHDLRGNVGVVATATRGLGLSKDAAASRDKFISILDRNVGSLRRLLDDVTSLTRLQAGYETRELAELDVSAEMADLCEGTQAFAAERGLYLRYEGPAPFLVTGDAVKLRRLAQNLILNALKYTAIGGVTLHWGDQGTGEDSRWLLSVRDTGPGMLAGPGSPLAVALQDATQLTHEVDGSAPSEPSRDSRPVREGPGEGIGLSIVKRLADLLDASVELDSAEATGTTFTVLLPKRYPR